MFDKIYEKLEKELKEKKVEMQKIIEQAEQAYKSRETAKKEMKMLKGTAQKEQEEFQVEWNKLGELIEDDKQNKDFINLQQNAKDEQRKQRQKDNVETLEEKEQKLKEKRNETTRQLTKETGSTQANLSKVEDYEDAFKSIKQATSIEDINDLVKEFEEAETNNFSLLRYVESLSTEIKELEDETQAVRSEIQVLRLNYRGPWAAEENNREKILKKLNAELEKTEAETKEYEEQYMETIKTINSLKIGIKSIFDRIGCSQDSV